MKGLIRLAVLVSVLVSIPMLESAAQTRGLVGVGLGVPVGDFADEAEGGAQSGGVTALAGVEWMPANSPFGLRLDGAYQQFCTTLCEETSGDRDVRYRFLDATLNGVLEFPVGTDAAVRPYVLAGVGIYQYKLVGDDAPSGLDSETDFGLNGGIGLTYQLEHFGIFGEARFHQVFAEDDDLQFIPVMIGARIGFR